MLTLLVDIDSGARLTTTTSEVATQAVAEMEGSVYAVTEKGDVLVWSEYHEGAAFASLSNRESLLVLAGLR